MALYYIICCFYSVLGGMHSIVLGDLIKYAIMTIGCIAIAVIAMQHLNGNKLNVPHGWTDPFFGWNLNLNWKGIVDDAMKKIGDDGYGLFGILFMMMLFKGVFASLAGPAPNYDMQKIAFFLLAEGSIKMTGFVSLILLPVRYSMIIGLTGCLDCCIITSSTLITVPAVWILKDIAGTINNFTGGDFGFGAYRFVWCLCGVLFPAHSMRRRPILLNDVYLKYVNPSASNKKVITVNYLSGIIIVAIGIALGFMAKDVNSILQWIVSGLYGGYIAANVLKWYWWRFNANGFSGHVCRCGRCAGFSNCFRVLNSCIISRCCLSFPLQDVLLVPTQRLPPILCVLKKFTAQ